MDCVVAYVPVLHEGYRRFLETHGRDRPFYAVGPELHADYRPLAKDIRALDAELVAAAVASWGMCSETAVLTPASAAALAEQRPRIVLPAEDVSYRLVDRFFERCEVRFDTTFLRWDRTRTVALRPPAAPVVSSDAAIADLQRAGEGAAAESVDWWRQVGAAIRLPSGELRTAHNAHDPHPLAPYAAGDPRSNFYRGVGYELSTATHAEARLIAEAARDGEATAGAVLYVTDFPCPPCARLIAAAGVSRLYFRTGYAVLDGEAVLEAAGVEVLQAA